MELFHHIPKVSDPLLPKLSQSPSAFLSVILVTRHVSLSLCQLHLYKETFHSNLLNIANWAS